ncbi:MAG: C25 family cysteine peptidase [Candidatus Eisenbacteria bacterium]
MICFSSRNPRDRFPLRIAFILLVLAAAPARGETYPDVRIRVSAGEYEIREVTVQGATYRRVIPDHPRSVGEAGFPDLPRRTYLVAVPDGYRARATVFASEHVDLPGPPVEPFPKDTIVGPDGTPVALPFRDEGFHRSSAWYPGELVTVGEPAGFRRHTVVPVTVHTFRTVPGSGLLRVYSSVDVHVRFEKDPGKAPPLTEPVGDEGAWESVYRSAIVNYEEARAFRSRPARSGPPPRLPGKRFGEEEWKLRVKESGLYRVGYEELAAAGFPAGVAIGALTLARRGFDDKEMEEGRDPFTVKILPIEVVDEGGDGFFGAGDALVAYLPGFREDRMERDDGDRFATKAVYFLTEGEGSPPFETKSGWRGFAGLTPLPSFPDSVRWEEDIFYDIGPVSDTTDYYYGSGKTEDLLETTVDLPAADPAGSFRVKGMTVSTLQSSRRYHRYMLVQEATGDTVFNEVVNRESPALFRSDSLFSSASLTVGENGFTYLGFRGSSQDNTDVAGAGGFLDWYEIHTDFLYRTRNGYTRFSTGKASGSSQMEVAGFPGADLFVLDVTDGYAPVKVSVDSVRSEGDGTFTLVMQESAPSTRAYVAAAEGFFRPLGEGSIVRSTHADLASREADYLILVHDDLAGAAVEELAAHREAQGLSVTTAKISEVYDEFHGGPKDPRAIQRYFRFAMEWWSNPPEFALLVGDGYEDYKGIAGNADSTEFDFIPAYPIWDPLPVGGVDHWTASDPWYALLDGYYDYLPEILIGRFPAGSVEEVETLVEKTIAYESEDPGAAWRRRVFFVADDAWTKDGALLPYRNSNQTQFETGSRALAERVTSQSAVRADTSTLWLSRHTDIYHPLCPAAPPYDNDPRYADLLCTVELVRDPATGVTAEFFDRSNGEGAFLVNFQGHGSRSSLTHEIFLVEGKEGAYTNQDLFDLSDYSTPGSAPYVFMGYGCNISEFEQFNSFGFDALGEVMVLMPGTGAVLTYGSTAIEYLTANLRLNDWVLDYFYPSRGDSAKVRDSWEPRRAGEIFAPAMAEYAADNYAYATARRYVILGDPALRIGPFPPEVTVAAGADTLADGAAVVPPADGPLAVEMSYAGDLWVDEGEDILVFEGGSPADSSRVSVTSGVDAESARWLWTVRYERPAGETGGEILFRIDDVWGGRTSRTVKTDVPLAVFFDGVLYDDTLGVAPVTDLEVRISTVSSLDTGDVRATVGDLSRHTDSLTREGDSVWVARFDEFALPEGMQNVEIAVGGLRRTYPVWVAGNALDLAATVDGKPVASGHHLLGHRDGTAPEIALTARDLRGGTVDSVRVLRGEAFVDRSLYSVTPDTIGGRHGLLVLYAPNLGAGEGEIRIEAFGERGTALFLFGASLPITLRIGGAAVLDGDFIAPMSEARAEAVYPHDLPAEEAEFLFDGVSLPIDTLRKEGTDRWIAVAKTDAGGGGHEIVFRAGGFSATRKVVVENRLRVVEPLCYPNPVRSRAGFVYSLTLPADDVRLEIYTVRGLRIRTLGGLSANAGYNENREVWDGRDQDGDPLARGVYPFRVTASREGEKAEAIGTLVIGPEGD